jgi:hypothetical protein
MALSGKIDCRQFLVCACTNGIPTKKTSSGAIFRQVGVWEWLLLFQQTTETRSELGEGLAHTTGLGDAEHVEAHSLPSDATALDSRNRSGQKRMYLGQRTALTNGHLVAESNVTESGRHVSADVLVALLEAVVLANEVQVVAADDECAGKSGAGRETNARTQRNININKIKEQQER